MVTAKDTRVHRYYVKSKKGRHYEKNNNASGDYLCGAGSGMDLSSRPETDTQDSGKLGMVS